MENELMIHEKIDSIVLNVLSQKQTDGFVKAHLYAKGINELKNCLDSKYMAEIMPLMNTKLGFKTDRPNRSNPKPYTVDEVRNCLIEAVFLGLQPYGNEFNIISGNCYPTKEGMGALLKQLTIEKKILDYDITPQLPRVNGESAAIIMEINYITSAGEEKVKNLDIPIKVNKMMGTDAIIGKATRKARAWLYNTVTGVDIADGDVTDIPYQDITSKGSVKQRQSDQKYEEEKQNLIIDIQSCENIDELKTLSNQADDFGLTEVYNAQLEKLN